MCAGCKNRIESHVEMCARTAATDYEYASHFENDAQYTVRVYMEISIIMLIAIRANGLDVQLRESYLSHVFWFAAHEALLLGYNDIAWGTLRLLRDFVRNRTFAFNSQEVHMQVC